ncbi:MAG: hypothetical protein HYV27_24320 [Candidatus Hydrogenedentes bacterium]|nr:hypothetical protein [Candidatus Hydrogenedentota bacterium]
MELLFRSSLNAPPAVVWLWATSSKGVNGELMPLLRMRGLKPFEALRDADPVLGVPLGTCWLLLFGVLPVDRVLLTPVAFEAGRHFAEESPMWSLRRWRHERTVRPEGEGTLIEDRLNFEARVFGPATKYFVRFLFTHRHRQLRRHFNGE